MRDLPIACDVTVLTEEQRRRQAGLRTRLAAFLEERRELDDGYLLRFRAAGSLPAMVGEYVDLERRCCPFLAFSINPDQPGTLSLSVTGPEGTKAFLTSRLGATDARVGEPASGTGAAGATPGPRPIGHRTPRRPGEPEAGRSKLFIAAGSAAAAVTAAICCVGPALLALFGIAAAGFGTAFRAGRPYLVAAALLFLAAGVYLAVRRRPGEGRQAASPAPWRRTSPLLWAAAAAALVLLGLSLFL